jgi:hypothetical protein
MNDLDNQAANQAAAPIRNYQQFYQFYLSEHANINCRRLHFVGSTLGLIGLGCALSTGKIRYALMGMVAGYACAWVGHFVFEHNRPATFKQPFYSFISDFRMYSDVLRGRISLKDTKFDSIS